MADAPNRAAAPDLDRTEVQVLSLLVIAHPEGLSDTDLRDMLQGHSRPCEAADRLVELGLAVRPEKDVGHWRATATGLSVGERV